MTRPAHRIVVGAGVQYVEHLVHGTAGLVVCPFESRVLLDQQKLPRASLAHSNAFLTG